MGSQERHGYQRHGVEPRDRLSILTQSEESFPRHPQFSPDGIIFSATVIGNAFFMKSKSYDHEGPWRASGQNKKIINVLDDLIRINIDRITAYEKASHVEITPEQEIREVFYRLATDSRAYVNTLHAEVIKLGGAPVTQSTISGKIYLYWLDGKHSFEGSDTPSRLDACMASEEAIQKAYGQALAEQTDIPERIYQLIENQLWALERAHRQLADLHESHNPNAMINSQDA
jgi:uncharacterized protein (TIGR02284 family)